MNTTQDIFSKIESILGAKIGDDGTLSIEFTCNSYAEAKSLLHQIRGNQKDLRALRREVNQICKNIRAEHSSRRTMVGKGVGAGIASAFLGRKTVGGFNAIRRDSLRDAKDAALAPYEDMKVTIDRIVHQLDDVKHNIEMSEEYANKPAKKRAKKVSSKQECSVQRKEARFYAFMGNQVRGPFDLQEIGALVKADVISADTQLCAEEEQDWHPMSHFFDI